MSRDLPLEDVHPSQLYLSSEKLADVLAWFDFDDPEYGPLPVFEHEEEWYLSDGHTRAFAAYLAGEETLSVERDTKVREKYDFEVYRACISWCEEEGVETVTDLRGRIVEPDTFQEVWIDRCQQVGTE
ncbi:hypothetical protein SAMN05216226_11642 [Halovenus aranensis]|jgi:hypothetical protein|uniref:ParB-like nuclease domain-containing protein n=1 Tax=Halovenus aranensis TaxID=890420 RepID=A0A1G8YU90_9EURY|nr:histone acetyltransferase [Halovenus aranensis]SDK06432.1 hypothetical protein SAMN05216226_11642 [Halovenus aranensis]